MTALSPFQLFKLDEACKPIRKAFCAFPYLVGSAAQDSPSFRDVDVRMILEDHHYDAMRKALGQNAINFIGLMTSDYLANLTGLPIDFQIQRQTEANEKHSGVRNPLGIRGLDNYKGDAPVHYPVAERGATNDN